MTKTNEPYLTTGSGRGTCQPVGDGLLFTVDDVYDRQQASDGHSRYGAYLALRMADPRYFGPAMLDDPLLWATFVWEIASPPAMSPGYVTWADQIENAFVFPGADGDFMAEVLVRTEPPVVLPGWTGWERTTAWGLVEPHYDLRTALTRVTLTVVLDAEPLAPPGGATTHAERVRAAKASVQSSAAAMEATVGSASARSAEVGRDHDAGEGPASSSDRRGTMTARRERTRYFTTEEVAGILAVRPKTVQRWIRHGHMNAVRLHRQWRIAEQEIQRLLEDGRHG